MHPELVDPKLILVTAVKWSDLGHAAKPFGLHEKWTHRVVEEFYELGDREKEMNISISPLCDRREPMDVAKSQLGFFRLFCVPLYAVVADLIDPRMSPWIQLNENLRTWRSKSIQIQRKPMALRERTSSQSQVRG